MTQPNKRWAKSRMNLIIIRVCLSLSSEKGRVYVTRWAFGCCWEEEEGGNGWLLRGHQDCIKCMHATVVMFGCAYHQVLQVILWSLGCEMWLGWSTRIKGIKAKLHFFNQGEGGACAPLKDMNLILKFLKIKNNGN